MTRTDLFTLYTEAVEASGELTFAVRCASEVASRLDSGRSYDCDEYRSLLAMRDHGDSIAKPVAS